MSFIWDATSLITCAKFQVEGVLVLDYALRAGTIVIPDDVRKETIDAGLIGGYADAVELKARLDGGQIEVRTAPKLTDPFEELLSFYGLQEGDKAVLRLALHAKDSDGVVTDDRLLFVVLHRCGQRSLFLPDFVECLVADGVLDAELGKRLLWAMRPRLPVGFVEHSLRRIEGVI